jgi:DNA-binding NarL/FixJ family response regulator
MPSVFLLRAREVALQRSKADLLACEGWELAGVAQRGEDALERITLLQPDVLLSDQRLLDAPLIRLLVQLAQQRHRLPVLVWNANPDDPALFESLLLGVRGFLPDAGQPQALRAALQSALEGRARLNPGLARELLRRLGAPRLAPHAAVLRENAHNPGSAGDMSMLSVAQQALLSLLAHGWLPQEISKAWAVQEHEIEKRIGQLLRLLPQLLASVNAVPA